MQVIKSIVRLLLFVLPSVAFGQSTYISQGDKAYDFMDRLEIKQGNSKVLNFSFIKPYNRKYIIDEVEKLYADSINKENTLTASISKADQYNLNSLLSNNREWVVSTHPDFESRKSLWGALYSTKANLFEINNKDLYLAVNPVLNYERSYGSAADKGAYINSRGVTVRGLISRKIGFSTTLTDNQQLGPSYFNDRVNAFHQMPGAGFYKPFKTTAFDYFDARGYISFQVAKTVDVQFGYDNNFMGNGYRSLFLSDYANSYLFLKLNVRKGKFEYQTLFTELFPDFIKTKDTLLDRKYGAFYHLGMNATSWLSVGAFEGVVFGNRNDFGLKNLNPLIFSRHLAGFSGSTDNAIAGLDIKANILHHVQLYGQLLLDEFDFSQLTKNNGYWGNKTGYQGGIKYVDVFNVPNLDIQLETNKVRPFTYAYNNSVASYSHYNLPLAHPLGANFKEYIAILKYQPLPKWRARGTIIYYKQGLDSAGYNLGSNIFENTISRSRDYGYTTSGGNMATCLNANFELSYEIRENLFVEGNILYRKYTSSLPSTTSNSKLISLGVRWNIFRRRYDL